jgi:hypothetical protein
MRKHTSTYLIAAFGIAAATACGNNGAHNNNTASSAAANTGAADRNNNPTPINLTGCLQQAGRTYVVTRLNEPAQKGVGTTGNGAAVEREQLREAANTYRLTSKQQDDWDKMVGKQVHVNGTVREAADLPHPDAQASRNPDGSTAATGTTDTTQREKIDKGDLAQIEVTSMAVVSDNCGAASGSDKPDTRR